MHSGSSFSIAWVNVITQRADVQCNVLFDHDGE